jgi:hypothetical protein
MMRHRIALTRARPATTDGEAGLDRGRPAGVPKGNLQRCVRRMGLVPGVTVRGIPDDRGGWLPELGLVEGAG